ncbi:hypothetical protein H5410_026156 [Solanum commersonii]|uniref:Uncharacterized protein n=1 Tax=Solanum commersonii TaxID=4109 RepID=A0A9J5YXY4_SOLCO|nr:hypothetical protein H5410_026156 [Solanum commersonii]
MFSNFITIISSVPLNTRNLDISYLEGHPRSIVTRRKSSYMGRKARILAILVGLRGHNKALV